MKAETGDSGTPQEKVDLTLWWPVEEGTTSYTSGDSTLVLRVDGLDPRLTVNHLSIDGAYQVGWILERRRVGTGDWQVAAILRDGGANATVLSPVVDTSTYLDTNVSYGNRYSYFATWEACDVGTCLRFELNGKDALDGMDSSWLLVEGDVPLEVVYGGSTWSR